MDFNSDHVTAEFLRFRDTGDVAALAAVFDATAERLLLVAARLVRDSGRAEDVVQTTFVHAIESAGRFDDRYPNVWAWLLQILRRRVVDLHRTERSRAGEARPLDGMVSRSGDPISALEGREIAQTLAGALRSLPPRYRAVLARRLEHDMEPREIAESLGMRPVTVRVRLKRGLDRIRHRFAAFGPAPVVAWLLAEPGRTATRPVARDRIRRARAPLSPRVEAKPAFAAALAIVVAVGGAIAATLGDVVDPPRTVAGDRVVREVPDEGGAEADATRSRVAAGRNHRESAAPPAIERALVAVWDDDGKPSPDRSIELRRFDLSVGARGTHVVTDSCGVASLEDVPAGVYEVSRSFADRTVVEIPSGPCRIPFRVRSTRLVGRVTNGRGPLRVWLSRGEQEAGRLVAAGDDGSFRIERATPGQVVACLLPDGRWTDAVCVPDTGSRTAHVELTAPDTVTRVRGRVRSASGRVVAGARIDATPYGSRRHRRPHPPLSTTSADDGTFSLVLPRADHATLVEVFADAHAFAWQAIRLDATPEMLDIELAPGFSLEGAVVDALGVPVASAEVSVTAPDCSVGLSVPTGADGRFRIGGLASGAWSVRVDGGRCGAWSDGLELGPSRSLDLALSPEHRVRGRVVDELGRPVDGIYVRARPSVEPLEPVYNDQRGVRTDRDGVFDLALPAVAVDGIEFRWRSDLPVIARLGEVPARFVTVDIGARSAVAYLEGCVASAADRLELGAAGESWLREIDRGADGAFRIGPLAPGSYELSLRDRCGFVLPCHLVAGETLDVGRLTYGDPR